MNLIQRAGLLLFIGGLFALQNSVNYNYIASLIVISTGAFSFLFGDKIKE